MTLNIKISHVSGDDYAAKVQQPNKPDVVIEPGEAQDFVLWDSETTNLVISEVPATKKAAASVGDTGNNTIPATDASEATTNTSETQTEGEQNNG